MAPKRQPSPSKHLSPPPSSPSSSGYEDEEEEEEEVQNNSTHNSTPTSSQTPKKTTSKKPTSDLNQTPNPNSSTEEEDDDDEEDEEEEDSEAEKAKKTQPKPTQIKKKEDEEEEEESDESGSDSGSDSDLPPSKVKPIKPITSKPMDSTPKPKKEAAAKPSTQKRPRPSASKLDSKKRKKPDAGEEEEETGAKKQLFQRIWTPEDELSILKAIIEFSKKGSDVSSDMNGFHEFVKKLLNVDMTRTQVSEKVRRMKKKYLNTAEKARKGKEPSFPKDHDKLMYELSKQIWGVDVETENNVERRSGGNAKRNRRSVAEKVAPKSPPPSRFSPAKENPSAPKSIEPKSIDLMQKNHSPLNGEVGNTLDLYPYLNESLRSNGSLGASALTEMDVKRALELMGHSQLKEWEERCIQLRSKERDVFMERTTLVYELAKQCYDLVKSSEE